MRAGDADLAVAPHATDGDLAIEPAALGETPPLEQAFTHAGFRPRGGDSVGVWVMHRPAAANTTTEFAIDLLVPASVWSWSDNAELCIGGLAPFNSASTR